MKRQLQLFLIIALIAIACEKVELKAPYQEIPVVYCILNPKDSTQYVRINRMYYCDDAYAFPQNPDSVTYPFGEWEVYLEQWRNDQIIAEPVYFAPTHGLPKEPGTFATDNHVLYFSTEPLLTKCEYVLKCRNKKSGLELEARASSLGKYNYVTVSDDRRTYHAASYFPEQMNYHGSLFFQNYEHRITRFYYQEIRDDSLRYLYVDWFPRENPLLIAPLKDDSTEGQFSDDYYRYLSECIPVDPDVKRVAVGVDKMFSIANEELFTYINLYTNNDIYYFVPDFTNITNGKGIFSCRYHYTYFGQKLRPETIDTISFGKYLKNHRFADSQGHWH
jgi:hypothetical protein